MDPIASRVAARYQRQVLSAFISKKWFKAQKDALKAALKAPLREDPESWAWVVQDKVIPFFKAFHKAFAELVTQDRALASIKDRVETATTYLEALVEKLPKRDYGDLNEPKSFLTWYAKSKIYARMGKDTKTVGDILKNEWFINNSGIDRLVQRILKGMPPEVIEAIKDNDAENTSWEYQRRSLSKYEYLDQIGFEAQAARLVKKTRLQWNAAKWVDSIYEMLEANYTEQAIQRSEDFQQFDLYGMRVVVDDRTVWGQDVKKYVQYLKMAYAALRSKGFQSAWYGTVFIQCEDCGGVNKNTGGGTGGWYEVGPDTVSIFSRPSLFIRELVIHELGHRYWYKQMNQRQRGKFESLIKVYKSPEISPVPQNKTEDANKVIQRTLRDLNELLDEFERDSDVTKYAPRFKKLILDDNPIYKTLTDLTGHLDRWKSQKLKDAIEEYTGRDDSAEFKLRLHLLDLAKYVAEFERNGESRSVGIREWIEDARRLVFRMGKAAYGYVDLAERLGQRDYDPEDRRPVPAVSDYGKSNISEAWAEAFMHYVLEGDMTQDQIESFKSVFSSTDEAIIERVVQAWTGR